MIRTATLLSLALLLGAPASSFADDEGEAPPAETEAPVAEAPPPEPVVPPGPWLWVKPSVAVAYGPLGLISDTKIQIRGPLFRSHSMVFQATYAGVGARVAITPAFVDVGPRFSLAPIDMLDVDVQLAWIGTWKGSSGLIPYDRLDGTLDAQRETRKGESVAGQSVYASVNPTFKIKLGPVIGFTSADFAFVRVFKPEGETSPFVYDAYRDMVIAWDDVVLTSWTGLLAEILDGGDKRPLLRTGALLRHRQAFGSKDITTALGGAVIVKPGPKPGWPTITFAVLGYLRDVDRALKAPNIQLQLAWEIVKPLSKTRATDLAPAGS